MYLKIIASVIICLAIGFGLGYYLKDDTLDPIVPTEIPPVLVEEETSKIDSLEVIIQEKIELVEDLRDSIQVNEETRTTSISEIKELPITEAVLFLELKLREYEEESN